MKTNQQMTVTLGEYGHIVIGHKTHFGRASDVLAMGNLLREQRGLKPFELDVILRKSDFWEFAIALNAKIYSQTQNGNFPVYNKESKNNSLKRGTFPLWIEPDFTGLEEHKDELGRIQYATIIKEMPAIIKSQRGGKVENRGVWMELTLLLKLASYLDKVLEVEIYDAFVKGNILEFRDESGDEYKALCKSMDDKGLISDTWDYAKVGQEIANCVLGTKQKGCWNDATEGQLEERKTLEKFLTQALDAGFITDMDGIMKTIEKRK